MTAPTSPARSTVTITARIAARQATHPDRYVITAGPIVYGGIHPTLEDARETAATLGNCPAGVVTIHRLNPQETDHA